MGKKKEIIYKLISSIGSNYCYYASKHSSKHLRKLSLLKFDPSIQQYTVFN